MAGRTAQLSFLFLRRSFFARALTHTNELDRTNILAPGFWLRKAHLLPAFTPEKFRGLALGKSYPVTAAQLIPNCTGFLAPIHFFKLAKNWINNYLLALGGSGFIYQS